ncbi:tail fiber assembly protein [Cedecea sp. S5-13]|uniref:tail fiber assembly protein n=1 Tax=Cedecea selenatireducens TaxID=3144416 RepID=UPI0035CD3281
MNMKHYKNFKKVEPTAAQIKRFGKETAQRLEFLASENGECWFECQKLFADDTIKIMYDSNNIILAIVDEPIPGMGDTLCAGALWPRNMSVMEVAPADFPVGCCADGAWSVMGGEIIRDEKLVELLAIRRNTKIRDKKVMAAMAQLNMLQISATMKASRAGDTNKLAALHKEIITLRDIDLTLENPAWPETA